MAKHHAMRIRTDDHVVVTGGKDRGKTGRVVRTDPKRRVVFVEGLNIVKRHQRPRSVKETQRGGEVGGIVEKEGPIHVSNVMLLDPQDNKPTRVGVRRAEGGKRERYSKRTDASID
jgi:large subunit ribosomal protein L24